MCDLSLLCGAAQGKTFEAREKCHPSLASEKRYPSERFPVLAFVGAPANFPVQQENLALQAHLSWSDAVLNRARHFIRTSLRAPFVGIHLRNGIDWVRPAGLCRSGTKQGKHLARQ
ncbi:hypothetical protein HPB48_001619 [Haemaphysalis longicornis]|uniref:GDP-fucose protein O-fucosyltransferase 1 n=1 Tax=Haemaphysalis longicornis TaxID=44386 RepID=A0A9J6FAS6_HAELO|nr:hypothetical protein HPB48_001619 [Haemaphysalis longicornis]